MQPKEDVIVFPKYGHIYDVQGGPDIDELLAALQDPQRTVRFRFIGEQGKIASEVEVQVNSVTHVDTDRTIYKVGGSVVPQDGFDTRITIQQYNVATKHGTRAGIFL